MTVREGGEPRRTRPNDFERHLAALRRRPLSRRRFLQVGGMTAAAAWLAACTKSVAPNRSGGTTAPAGELEDELVIYNWTNYLNEETIKAFEAEYGVKIRATDFFESNEEMLAKIQGGAKGYDLVAPTGYMIEIMAGENLLLQLDKARVPNLANVQPQFLNLSFDPQNNHSVPKDWGTTGFMYLTDKVGRDDLATWDDFYKIAPDFSGKYTVLDGAVEVVGSQLKRLGYSWNSTTQSEVDEATEALIDFKPHVAAITSTEYRELMSRADTWLALGWNGDYFYILEDQENTKYVIPSEGTEFWVDTWAILADAPHPNLAHEFINWILTPERQAVESDFTYYASAVEGAKELTDEAVSADPSIYPEPEVTSKLEATEADPIILEQRTEAFTRFQAA